MHRWTFLFKLGARLVVNVAHVVMLDFEFMLQIAPKMFSALWITVQLSCLAVLFSILFGAILTAIRMLGGRLSRYAVICFVEFTRGTPPLVHISIIYFLMPQIGVMLNEFWSGVVALSLIGAGYTIEIFRGAIESIPAGQTDAGRALGLSRIQSFFFSITTASNASKFTSFDK